MVNCTTYLTINVKIIIFVGNVYFVHKHLLVCLVFRFANGYKGKQKHLPAGQKIGIAVMAV